MIKKNSFFERIPEVAVIILTLPLIQQHVIKNITPLNCTVKAKQNPMSNWSQLIFERLIYLYKKLNIFLFDMEHNTITLFTWITLCDDAFKPLSCHKIM